MQFSIFLSFFLFFNSNWICKSKFSFILIPKWNGFGHTISEATQGTPGFTGKPPFQVLVPAIAGLGTLNLRVTGKPMAKPRVPGVPNRRYQRTQGWNTTLESHVACALWSLLVYLIALHCLEGGIRSWNSLLALVLTH